MTLVPWIVDVSAADYVQAGRQLDNLHLVAAVDRDEAAVYFQQALKVEGASDMARKAASEGLQNSSKQ